MRPSGVRPEDVRSGGPPRRGRRTAAAARWGVRTSDGWIQRPWCPTLGRGPRTKEAAVPARRRTLGFQTSEGRRLPLQLPPHRPGSDPMNPLLRKVDAVTVRVPDLDTGLAFY